MVWSAFSSAVYFISWATIRPPVGSVLMLEDAVVSVVTLMPMEGTWFPVHCCESKGEMQRGGGAKCFALRACH